MNNNFSITGYKDDSPDRNNNYNVIPGRNITMQGVSKQLTLVPIVNGQPQYDRKRTAKPGDSDIEFESDVEGVLEIPYAQMGMGNLLNPQAFQQFMYPVENFNSALNYGTGVSGNSYAENSNPNLTNPYVNANQTQMNLPGGNIQGLDPSKAVAPNFSAPPTYNPNVPNEGAVNQFNSRVNTFEIGTGGNTGIPENTDPNEVQRYQAELAKQQQSQQSAGNNSNPFIGAINPYGGWNMQNTATALGAFAQNKNILGTVASAGKLLLEGSRNALAGAAAMKVYNESKQEYEDKMDRAERRQGWSWLQKGGEIGKILTGNFVTGEDDHPNPNVEFERGEYVQTPDGNSMEVLGDRHSEGGELANMPEGTKVITDYLPIGSRLAKQFKKDYGLNVKSGSTFATVLDKYKQKIGLSKMIDEESGLMQKIADQDKVEFEGTRDINLQVLSKRVNDIQPEKLQLEDKFNTFTNFIYEKQEQSKEPGEYNFEKQQGGQVDNAKNAFIKSNYTGASDQYKKAKIDPQVIVENLNSTASTFDGANHKPDWMIKRDSEFRQGYLYHAAKNPNITYQNGKWVYKKQMGGDIQQPPEADQIADSQQPQPGQTPPQSTDGQTPVPQQPQSEIEQLIFAYCQITGENPQDIVQQLQQMDTQQLEQTVQQMMEVVQQTDMSQEQQNVQPNPDEEQSQAVEQFKKGGSIIYAQAGNRVSRTDFDKLRADYVWDANYDYGNLDEEAKAIVPFLERNGIKYNPEDLKTQAGMDKLAGLAQQAFRNNFKGVSNHYSSQVAATQQGLQTALDNGLLSQKNLRDLGVKVNKGQVLRGSKGLIPSENEQKLVDLITKKGKDNPNAYNQYVDKNFVDNRWYFRNPNIRTVEFDSQKDIDEYVKKNGYDVVEDISGNKIYNTDKQGLYFNPVLKGQAPAEPVSPGTPANTPASPNNPDPSGDIKNIGNLDRNFNDGLPMLTPDQSNLPPNYIPTTLRQVGHIQANPIAISPEETIKELSRQYNTAVDTMTETNPYTSGSAMANLQAQTNNSINQAYSQAAMANAQDRRNVENINEERIQARDNSNIQMMGQYEKEAIVGLDNYIQSWRNYIDNRNLQNVNNWNLENQRQAFNAVNDNFKIGSMGWYQTDETPVFYFNGANGQPMAYNTRTKQTYEVSKKNQDGTKTKSTTETTTNPPKNRQKGGLLLSKDIKNWLK